MRLEELTPTLTPILKRWSGALVSIRLDADDVRMPSKSRAAASIFFFIINEAKVFVVESIFRDRLQELLCFSGKVNKNLDR